MNTLHSDQIAALSRLPSLQGAPLSIFVAMLIAQQPLQAKELETYTGLANGAVTSGLTKLTHLRAVINLGRRGWILSPDWQQLTLPLQFLSSGVNHENRDLDHENRDLPPLLVSCLVSDDREEDNQLTNQPGRRANHENRDLPLLGEVVAETNTVAYWLKKAGVVPGSKQMTLLVQKITSPEYAKAHALQYLHERRTWEKAGKRDREPGTGTLIYRLDKGWSSPAMRCEECLRLERECTCEGRYLQQQIPDALKDIIKR